MQSATLRSTTIPTIDIKDIFHLNDLIQLSVDGKPYRSRIEDVYPKEIVVGAPFSQGELINLKPGKRIIVFTLLHSTLHGFNCTIKEVKDGRVPMLVLEEINDIGEVQRRKFFRVATKLPVHYRLDKGRKWRTAITENISGGGILATFTDSIDLSPGDMIEAKIILPGEYPILTASRVIRVCNVPGADGTKGNWAAEFIYIHPKARNRIIQYVHEREVALNIAPDESI